MKESNNLMGIITIVLIVSITYVLSATQCDANDETADSITWSSTPPTDYKRLSPPAHELAWSTTQPAGYKRLAPPLFGEA
jgi:hypothetical protein